MIETCQKIVFASFSNRSVDRFYGSIYVKQTLLFVEPILEDMLVNFPTTYSKSRTKRSSVNAYVYKVYSRKLSSPKHKKHKNKV